MEERMICVPYDEYQKMAEMYGKVQAFIGYAIAEKYSINRDLVAAMLGFSLPAEDEENG